MNEKLLKCLFFSCDYAQRPCNVNEGEGADQNAKLLTRLLGTLVGANVSAEGRLSMALGILKLKVPLSLNE